MTDYTELKRLAEVLLASDDHADFPGWMAASDAFDSATGPAAILALIAENERLNTECKQMILLECHGGTAEAAMNLLVERDQLKAENEALCKDLESHKRMLLAAACDLGAIGEALGADMDDDGSELEGIATQLRKDAERLQSATAFVQKLCDSAGKQPSVATGYLHDILSALGEGEPS